MNNNKNNKRNNKKKEEFRYFSAVNAKYLGNGKYKIDKHSILSPTNRYKISEKQSPQDAAKKIFRNICGSSLYKNSACKMSFVIREVTRNSSGRLFFYDGHRINIPKNKQKKPVKFPGRNKLVTFPFKYEIKATSAKKLGHTNPLPNWKSRTGLKGVVNNK